MLHAWMHPIKHDGFDLFGFAFVSGNLAIFEFWAPGKIFIAENVFVVSFAPYQNFECSDGSQWLLMRFDTMIELK